MRIGWVTPGFSPSSLLGSDTRSFAIDGFQVYSYIHRCMYICKTMYACMYVCMYMYVSMYLCMYVHMYVCMYVFMYVCIYVCIMYICISQACKWHKGGSEKFGQRWKEGDEITCLIDLDKQTMCK